MKITIAPDGTVELLDVTNGDGQVALDLIRSLQAKDPEKPVTHDPSALTPTQKQTYEVLEAHAPHGCHYTSVAEFLGIDPSIANSRCNQLRILGYAERVRAGVYIAVTQ